MSEKAMLVQNLNILAIAMGYTKNKLLNKIRYCPSTYTHDYYTKSEMDDKVLKKLDHLIFGKRDQWLFEIYDKANKEMLANSDICRFGDTKLPDTSCRTILTTNLRPLRWIFSIYDEELARIADCNRTTVYKIEHGGAHVSDKMIRNVADAFAYIYQSRARSKKEFNIIKKASLYPILLKIPNRARF